ncbi:EpsG family protein [Vibrio parahaemolyticus O1:K58]|nr:EpsG family protein [Vibrio parahaemolyticus O1:K58]EKO7418758.1 EpsG family protein [Vibrio parahaemolyticus]
MNPKSSYISLSLSILTILFPVLSFFFNVFYYLINNRISLQSRVIIYFNVCLAMAMVAFLYYRVGDSGDVVRYALSLEYYKSSLNNGRLFPVENLYEMMYPFWYSIFYFLSKFDFSVQALNFFSAFTIYGAYFFIIHQFDKELNHPNASKSIFIKVFFLISFVAIFSGYKTLWAFSLVSVGIVLFFRSKFFGVLFFALGAGIHPVAYVPILAFFISRIFDFKLKYLLVSLLVGILLKQVAFIFSYLTFIPFLSGKIQTYIYGDWSVYRFHDSGEYIRFLIMLLICLFIFLLSFFYKGKFSFDRTELFGFYNNFAFWYFCLAITFIDFRTIAGRLIIDGSIFFIPLFYQAYANGVLYRKKVVSILLSVIWLGMIDVRTFNYANESFIVGDGFPYNLLYSPLLEFIK